MFNATEHTATRTAVEYGERIIIVADTEKRANLVHWRGDLYYGECIAVIPMKPVNVPFFAFNNWVAHFFDYEGDPVTAEFVDLFDAFNYCDKHAEQMLNGWVERRERGER